MTLLQVVRWRLEPDAAEEEHDAEVIFTATSPDAVREYLTSLGDHCTRKLCEVVTLERDPELELERVAAEDWLER